MISAWLPLLQAALAQEGVFRFPLRGASMRPTLPVKCEIEIVPLPPQAPLGSLIVFVSGDALIAHRLVRRSGGLWIAQGDGRRGPDRPLPPDQVLGVVSAAYRAGERCWPGRLSGALSGFWVARHHALRVARAAWHGLKRLLAR